LIIGPADEFWRLRLTRMDPSDEFDFEWHEDILWRQPQVHLEPGEPAYLVEAVSISQGPERIVGLAAFPDETSAREFLAEASDDLRDMTRSQFESAQFPDQTAE
jgi:hypothetical protein